MHYKSVSWSNVSVTFSVVLWGTVMILFKYGTKIIAGGKAKGIGKVGDADIGFQKFLFGVFQLLQGNIFGGRDSDFIFKFDLEVGERVAGNIRQILQVHCIMDILVQVSDGSGDIGIKAVDITVEHRLQKLQAE